LALPGSGVLGLQLGQAGLHVVDGGLEGQATFSGGGHRGRSWAARPRLGGVIGENWRAAQAPACGSGSPWNTRMRLNRLRISWTLAGRSWGFFLIICMTRSANSVV